MSAVNAVKQSKIDEEKLDRLRFYTPDNCPICHCKPYHKLGDVATIHPRSKTRISIMRCDTCGHWYSCPVPRQEYLSELYAAGSLSVLGEGWETTFAPVLSDTSANPGYSHWILEDELKSRPGNYLEFGPGDCRLLSAFRRLGWNGWGVELGRWAKDGQIVAQLRDLPQDIEFDVVVLHDVLEHVAEPGELIREIAERMPVTSRLYMAFPNVDSAWALILRTRWNMVRPIGHLHYFSRRSIETLVKIGHFRLDYAKKTAGISSGTILCDQIRGLLFRLQLLSCLGAVIKDIAKRLVKMCGIGDQWNVRATKI